MMWERCRELVEAAGGKVACSTAVTAHPTTRAARAVAVDRRRRRRRTTHPCRRTSSRRCRSPSCCAAMDPPAPAEVRAAADACATATSSPSPSSCPTESAFPDNWIYVHAPEVQVGPDPELRLLVAVHGQGRAAPASAWSTSSSRATSSGTLPDDELVALGKRELGGARAWSSRRDVRGRLRRAHAQGVPGLRRGLHGATSRCCAPGWTRTRQRAPGRAATACTATTTRTTRCSRRCSPWRTSSTARRARRLVGQRRGGVPRGEPARPGPGATPRSCPRSGPIPQPHEAITGTSPTATMSSAGSAAASNRESLVASHTVMASVSPPERPQQRGGRELLHHLDQHEQRSGGEARPEQREVDVGQHPRPVGAEGAGGVVEVGRDPRPSAPRRRRSARAWKRTMYATTRPRIVPVKTGRCRARTARPRRRSAGRATPAARRRRPPPRCRAPRSRASPARAAPAPRRDGCARWP